ncbi:DUF11 domain-containing protein [Asanoa siamensis]|uniref:DUF11 domain-containing protein n=1 Tax=Asanoa siamensis TaxID=926357 RepID=A0ABQ4CVT6_9ACTN|nr:DUF11 domain-containing protein [Asanoa siamensis]GIF75406.1 hypothetical protein Asi02nite_49240 [Asanoa siamensis]
MPLHHRDGQPNGRLEADLVVSASADPTTVVDVGGGVAVRVDVRNAGTKAAQDVVVRYAMPPGGYFTDGNSPPAGWQCDFQQSLTCGTATLAAGTAATLRFYVAFPPGQVGGFATVTATASTASNETSTGDNTARATATYIRGVTDLVTGLQVTSEAGVGDTVAIAVDVRNIGNMTAEEVHVTVPVPAGLTRQSEDIGDGWYCDVLDGADPAWHCVRYQLVNPYNDVLDLTATVTDTSPGDTVTVTASATTTSPEDDVQNNNAQATVTIR